MIARKLGIWGSALLVAAVVAGCSASIGSDQDQTGVSSSALVQTNPTPPYEFPEPVILNGLKAPYTCEGRLHKAGATGDPVVKGIWASNAECSTDDGDRHGCQNYLAIPATHQNDNNGVADPHWTPYTHGYSFNATSCGPNDLTCQLESDFYSIPKGQGFKYNIKRIVNGGIRCFNVDGSQKCAATTTTHNWLLGGVQRADTPRWNKPWHFQGVPAPWLDLTTGTMIDLGAHPAYGSDHQSLDWLKLWNVAYTYSATGPNSALTQHIESEHHQCAAVFVYNASGELTLYDYFVAIETHDPIGTPW